MAKRPSRGRRSAFGFAIQSLEPRLALHGSVSATTTADGPALGVERSAVVSLVDALDVKDVDAASAGDTSSGGSADALRAQPGPRHRLQATDSSGPAVIRFGDATVSANRKVVSLRVTFDSPVKVRGKPFIAFTLNDESRRLVYSGGAGGRVLTFAYKAGRREKPTTANVVVASPAITLPLRTSIANKAGNAAVSLAAPADISLTNTSVSDGTTEGAVVGTLRASDADGARDTFTYTLSPVDVAPDNAAFTIDGDTLKSAIVFNANTKTGYSILIRAADRGGLSIDKQLSVAVNRQAFVAVAVSADATGYIVSFPGGVSALRFDDTRRVTVVDAPGLPVAVIPNGSPSQGFFILWRGGNRDSATRRAFAANRVVAADAGQSTFEAWTVDATGILTSSRSVTATEAAHVESDLGVDVDGDGTITTLPPPSRSPDGTFVVTGWGVFEVPPSFQDDGMSAPFQSLGWAQSYKAIMDARYADAWRLHDFLYSQAARAAYPQIDRSAADAILLRHLLDLGCSEFHATAIWAAVELGGKSHFETGGASPPTTPSPPGQSFLSADTAEVNEIVGLGLTDGSATFSVTNNSRHPMATTIAASGKVIVEPSTSTVAPGESVTVTVRAPWDRFKTEGVETIPITVRGVLQDAVDGSGAHPTAEVQVNARINVLAPKLEVGPNPLVQTVPKGPEALFTVTVRNTGSPLTECEFSYADFGSEAMFVPGSARTFRLKGGESTPIQIRVPTDANSWFWGDTREFTPSVKMVRPSLEPDPGPVIIKMRITLGIPNILGEYSSAWSKANFAISSNSSSEQRKEVFPDGKWWWPTREYEPTLEGGRISLYLDEFIKGAETGLEGVPPDMVLVRGRIALSGLDPKEDSGSWTGRVANRWVTCEKWPTLREAFGLIRPDSQIPGYDWNAFYPSAGGAIQVPSDNLNAPPTSRSEPQWLVSVWGKWSQVRPDTPDQIVFSVQRVMIEFAYYANEETYRSVFIDATVKDVVLSRAGT